MENVIPGKTVFIVRQGPDAVLLQIWLTETGLTVIAISAGVKTWHSYNIHDITSVVV